jgi:hypothetical protein
MQRPVRRSQLIAPFGIGAMVDFPKGESLMPAALDFWPKAKETCPTDTGWLVQEERLQARLGVDHFRQPPDFRKSGEGVSLPEQKVPFVRFPSWHYCHRCGLMRQLKLEDGTWHCHGGEGSKFEQDCKRDYGNGTYPRSPKLIPVRFVAVCTQGHLQDFPFLEFLHGGPVSGDGHQMKMMAGRSSAGLTGIKLSCTCGVEKVLGDVFAWKNDAEGGALAAIGIDCVGNRPWLGRNPEPCGKRLRVVQRGASNVYFPSVLSSLYLPLWAEEVTDRRIIDTLEMPHIWRVVERGISAGMPFDETRCEDIADMHGLDRKQFLKAVRSKIEGSPPQGPAIGNKTEEEFRQDEYQALCDARGSEKCDLYIKAAPADQNSDMPYFSKVQLVHKLRETRALAGFTRLLPPDGNTNSNRLQKLKIDPTINWLPAIKVYGEGIFVELDQANIDAWADTHPEIRARVSRLEMFANEARVRRGQPARVVTPQFVLIHTLAHVLINQLAFDCGYGSASLRERLFCNQQHPEFRMHGVLIYTASGDSEGTMGGLVRMGHRPRLEAVLRRAIARAKWCSSDPVCIESEGQGADNANLAACHGCTLLPETSCEEGNRLLDRALLVGLPSKPDIGFFNSL